MTNFTSNIATGAVGASFYPSIGNNLQAGTVWVNTNASSPTVQITAPLMIEYNGSKIDVGQSITLLMERLCLIEPNLKLHDKYPALKEAYDAYKAIEAMCKTGDNDE